jgi:hypothetical protein
MDGSGIWKLELAKPLQDNISYATSATFNALFGMVMRNGSAIHNHTISDFKQTSSPRDSATNLTTFIGTVYCKFEGWTT